VNVKRKNFTALSPAKLQFVEPMYARLIQKLPEGQDWQYEIKFDGYRCLAGRNDRGAMLWSRRENLFNHQFPEIALACERLKPDTLLDGEIVAIDKNGRVSFNLLQNHRSRAIAIQYYVFDMITCEGKSLLRVPLAARREMLAETLKEFGSDTPLRFSEAIAAPPERLIAVAKEMGFEGVVAKRKDSCYEFGKRSGAVKFKIHKSQPLVVGGYTPGNPFDALIVGYYRDGELVFAGKVRNGFVPRLRAEVAQKLMGSEIHACPFANLPERKRTPWALTREEMKNCVWVNPALVAEIEFLEWTVEDQLRQSRFVALREDKNAADILRKTNG
jgi:bifunctional non-homologous end joining protein LigD